MFRWRPTLLLALREPFELPREADQAKALLCRLGSHFGGDPQAAEPARILRVPGTLNYKYSPARSVTVALFDQDRRYNPSDFDEWLPAVATPQPNAAPVSLAEPIREGHRNDVLYRFGRGLKAKGLPVVNRTGNVGERMT